MPVVPLHENPHQLPITEIHTESHKTPIENPYQIPYQHPQNSCHWDQAVREAVPPGASLAMASGAAFTGGASQPAKERRQARDGKWYTFGQLMEYYPDRSHWDRAKQEAGRSTAQGNAGEFHGRMDTTAPAAEPAAAPAAPAARRNLVPQPWMKQSPDQGPKRNAQGHVERSASAERRIAERMVELEMQIEANKKLHGPEHVWKPPPDPNLGAYPYHCGPPDRWG